MANASMADTSRDLSRSPACPSPSFVLDLSGEKTSADCFLLGYTSGEDGCLVDLTVVVKNAVYSKGNNSFKSCVDKPPARKNLSELDHLSKMRDVLVAASSSKAAALTPARDPSRGNRTCAALPLRVSDDEAVLTVKEAVKGGSSFVVLATVRLPVVKEASGGLLFGVVRAAYQRGDEADRLRIDRERADQERAKLKGLLDTAIKDKRKVLLKLLERAALVVNSKKARIAILQEQGNGDESGGSEGADEEEEEEEEEEQKIRQDQNTSTGDDGTGEDGKEGKGKTGQTPVGPTAEKKSKTQRGGATGPMGEGAEGGNERGRGGVGGAAKVKTEPGFDSFGGMGRGGGALAVPMGTQEVSGDDLLLHFAGGEASSGVGGGSSGARGWKTSEGGGGGQEDEEDRMNDDRPKIKTESKDDGGDDNSIQSMGKGVSTERSRRPHTALPSSASAAPRRWNLCDSDSDEAGCTGTINDGVHRPAAAEGALCEALKHIGGGSSGSDEAGDGTRSRLTASPRRRRKRKTPAPTGMDAGGGSGSGSGGDRAGGSHGAVAKEVAGNASGRPTAKKETRHAADKKQEPPKNAFHKMFADDDSFDIDDLE